MGISDFTFVLGGGDGDIMPPLEDRHGAFTIASGTQRESLRCDRLFDRCSDVIFPLDLHDPPDKIETVGIPLPLGQDRSFCGMFCYSDCGACGERHLAN